MKAIFLFVSLFIASSIANADDYGCELKTEFGGQTTGYAMEYRGRDAVAENEDYRCTGYFVSPTESDIRIESKLTGAYMSGRGMNLVGSLYSPAVNAPEKVSCLCSLR